MGIVVIVGIGYKKCTIKTHILGVGLYLSMLLTFADAQSI